MTYDEIKAQLANARSMLDAGHVDDADRLIRSMLGKGLTLNDIDVGLTPHHRKMLREHSKRGAA